MKKKDLLQLIRDNAEILESPPLNARLLFGFPDTEPTVWINDVLQDENEGAEIAQLADKSKHIKKQPFRGKNGLTYYRYTLQGDK